VLSTSEKILLNVEGLYDAKTPHGERRVSARRGWAGETSDFFSILLGLCREVSEEPIADRCGHLVKILLPSELVIGAWEKIQPRRTSQRVTQSQALMEGDTFILLTLDN
jgi:hypothetical protein